MNGLLEKELSTYEIKKSELIGKYKGKFALLKHDTIIDIFDSELDAIRQGYQRFGNVPFLVRQILEIDLPQNFTSNLFGNC